MAKAPFIRAYDAERDTDAFIHVFRETAHHTIRTASELNPNPDRSLAVGEHIWCLNYLSLVPESCFALDDGEGMAVGYILCAPTSRDFMRRWNEEYMVEVGKRPEFDKARANKDGTLDERLLQELWYPQRELEELDQKFPRLLGEYPAELHIDILPAYQRQGYGTKLMMTLVEWLREHNVRGIHLGTALDMADAMDFYVHLGFLALQDPDEGQSGEGAQWFIALI